MEYKRKERREGPWSTIHSDLLLSLDRRPHK